jgi:hypothetical protein
MTVTGYFSLDFDQGSPSDCKLERIHLCDIVCLAGRGTPYVISIAPWYETAFSIGKVSSSHMPHHYLSMLGACLSMDVGASKIGFLERHFDITK